MMAEKVEMKRTLLQHDLCRIQIFPKPRPDAEKRDTIYLVRALFRYALLTHRRILLPRPIGGKNKS